MFDFAISAQLTPLWNDRLADLDALLNDPQLLGIVRSAQGTRSPGSVLTGRPTLAADRLLRTWVFKHIKALSFRQLHDELVDSLLARRFTHFEGDPIPHYCTFSRLFALLDPDTVQAIHRRVMELAQEAGIARGLRMRTDTTAVETDVHYPTDSGLLADGVRVLTRGLKKIAKQCAEGAMAVVDHSRAVKRQIFRIAKAARSKREEAKNERKNEYRKLLALTRAVLRQVERTQAQLAEGQLRITGSAPTVAACQAQLHHYQSLVQRVVAQTKARILRGDTHYEDKLLSLFETHTKCIRKGKRHKPNEFGRLVRVDEVENGIVSGYQVLPGNDSDVLAWEPALDNHIAVFGRPPKMATADRGYWSPDAEKIAHDKGVKRVAIPYRGKRSNKRAAHEKQRWFRQALRWRAGIEGRIGTLKNSCDMARANYRGEAGYERYIGACVIANNLKVIARLAGPKPKGHHG